MDFHFHAIQKEQDIHGQNLLDIGEWKLTGAKDISNSNRSLDKIEYFWEKKDNYIRTGYNTFRYLIRYSNEVLINWSKYNNIKMKFRQIKPGSWTSTRFGLGFGNGMNNLWTEDYKIGLSAFRCN